MRQLLYTGWVFQNLLNLYCAAHFHVPETYWTIWRADLMMANWKLRLHHHYVSDLIQRSSTKLTSVQRSVSAQFQKLSPSRLKHTSHDNSHALSMYVNRKQQVGCVVVGKTTEEEQRWWKVRLWFLCLIWRRGGTNKQKCIKMQSQAAALDELVGNICRINSQKKIKWQLFPSSCTVKS